MAARNYSNTAIQTTLSSGINSSTTSVLVAATTGFPSVPFIVALDAGAAAQELVLVTAVAGTNLTVTRGYDGTTAVSHDAGAVVQHAHAAIEFREANEHVQATAAHGATGAVVGTTNTQTLSNKTVDLASNTVTGTIAQFNTAVSDANLATSADLTTHEADTSTHGVATVAGVAEVQTLTNKTIALGSNTVSGTTAQFNTANTDGDFATLAGTETLTNKTLTSPSITGIGAVSFVVKTSDESVTSSTTYQDDDQLTLSIPAAGTYVVDVSLRVASASDTSGDIKLRLAWPTPGNIYDHWIGPADAIASGNEGDAKFVGNWIALSPNAEKTFGLTSTDMTIRGSVVVEAGGSGTLTLQWAQVASSPNASRVKVGSYMLMRRVS